MNCTCPHHEPNDDHTCECWRKGHRAGVMSTVDALTALANQVGYDLIAYLRPDAGAEAVWDAA